MVKKKIEVVQEQDALFNINLQDKKSKEVIHILKGLYKIKSIKRNTQYSINDIQDKVIKSKPGYKVIEELIKKGITKDWLEEKKLFLVQVVLGPYLKN